MKLASARTRRAPAPVKSGKPDPDTLRTPGEIEQAEPLAELPVRPGGEVELRGLAPGTDHPVPRGITIGHAGVREVGDPQENPVQLFVDDPDVVLQRLGAFTRRLELGEQIVGWGTRLLPTRDLLGGRVPARLQCLGQHQGFAPAPVEQSELGRHGIDGRIEATAERGTHRLGILAEAFDVDHGLVTASECRAAGSCSRNSDWPAPGT